MGSTTWVRRVYDDRRYVDSACHAGAFTMPGGEFVALCGVRLPARTMAKATNRLVPAGDDQIRSDVRTCSVCRQITGRRVVPLADSFAGRLSE